MQLSALLTSAGINIAICVVLLSLYSILRKQPSNYCVYFGRKLASGGESSDPFWYERFVPSPSWIVKAWETTEDELLAIAGLDAVVLMRMVIFSIRIFFIAAFICIALVLPVNYYGQHVQHKEIHLESLDVFSIANVKVGSKWLWVHCLSLYVISVSVCLLLYFEYKSIAKKRLAHITGSSSMPNQFAVLIRAIPWSPGQPYSESVRKYFTKYYPSSYLSHQMVYHVGTIQKLLRDAEKMCKTLKDVSVELNCNPGRMPCTGGPAATSSFQMLPDELDSSKTKMDFTELTTIENETPAAFVFFKSRYDALVVAEVLQTPNPMSWVAELAPEPRDVYWRNLSIPFRQLWIRRIATLVGAIAFMFAFLPPVTFIQGLTQLDQLTEKFHFLRGILKNKYMNPLITGYLPSVILILFLYAVPPTMMYFSVLEGCTSRSGRKKSACIKVLYFTIWNVFFVNVLSGSVIRQLSVFTTVSDIPTQLAKAVPTQNSFFMTYVFTSGWASLACEIVQPVGLIWNWAVKLAASDRDEKHNGLRFPYHSEVPRLLLFGLLGLTNSIMAPLILPFLLIYFSLAYFIYRNQLINVYVTKYESGGQYWPIFYNTTIFSLVMTQLIALGIFGLKRSPVASGFTFPLIFLTLLFSVYCRNRFLPVFKKHPAQVLIDMDHEDEHSGKLEDFYKTLQTAYSQIPVQSEGSIKAGSNSPCSDFIIQDPESLKPEMKSSPAKANWDCQKSQNDEERNEPDPQMDSKSPSK